MTRLLDKALALLRAGKLPKPTDAAVVSGFVACAACKGLGEVAWGAKCMKCVGTGRQAPSECVKPAEGTNAGGRIGH